MPTGTGHKVFPVEERQEEVTRTRQVFWRLMQSKFTKLSDIQITYILTAEFVCLFVFQKLFMSCCRHKIVFHSGVIVKLISSPLKCHRVPSWHKTNFLPVMPAKPMKLIFWNVLPLSLWKNKFPLNENILLWHSDTRSQITSRNFYLGEDEVQPQGFRNMCEDKRESQSGQILKDKTFMWVPGDKCAGQESRTMFT